MSKKISYYRKKADRLFQIYIVNKYPKCELCNGKTICGHHFITKAASSALRYEEENMIPVDNCHLKFHSKFGSEMNGIIIEKRGIEWFKRLRTKKEVYQNINIGYYLEIIKELENYEMEKS